MSESRTPLPVIRVDVATPCTMSWDEMTPADDSGRRFCEHCQRHVHDLSRLRGDEVVDLICKNAGNLCVRYEQLPGGGAKTLEYADRSGEGLRTRRWLLAGVIVSLLGGVANAMWHRKQPSAPPLLMTTRAPVPMVMGGISAPLPLAKPPVVSKPKQSAPARKPAAQGKTSRGPRAAAK
jgi:hypothetical protein